MRSSPYHTDLLHLLAKGLFYHRNNKMDKIDAVSVDDTTRPAQ